MSEYIVLTTQTKNALKFAGFADARAAHAWGMPHTTVLLVPVIQAGDHKEPRLVIHRRSPQKLTSPDKLDFAGGHLSAADGTFIGKAWESEYDLEGAILKAALREGNEEIRLPVGFQISGENLSRVGAFGAFDCHTETPTGPNVEFSTCFLVSLPSSDIRVFDTDPDGRERELAVSAHTIGELLDLFSGNSGDFADGASRILNKISCDPALAGEFRNAVHQAGSFSQKAQRRI